MKKRIVIIFLMLFNLSMVCCFAGDTKVYHPVTNKLMDSWYDFENKMLKTFLEGEDSIQNINKEYLQVMRDFKKVEEILFNQLMKNEVPLSFFTFDCAEGALILKEIAECTAETVKIVTQNPVDANSFLFATESQIQIGIRIADIIKQTAKALTSSEMNLRNNKYRENIVIKAIQDLREVHSRASDVIRILKASKNIVVFNGNSF